MTSLTSTIDGNPFISGTTISNLKPGTHTLAIIASDTAGNHATKQIIFSVVYNFGGFLPPIKSDGSGIYKLGRTLPVKFVLSNVNGNFVTSSIARLAIANVQNSIVGTSAIDLSTSLNDVGTLFRVSDNQYIYNLDTGQLSVGTWQLKVVLDDGTTHVVLISTR